MPLGVKESTLRRGERIAPLAYQDDAFLDVEIPHHGKPLQQDGYRALVYDSALAESINGDADIPCPAKVLYDR